MTDPSTRPSRRSAAALAVASLALGTLASPLLAAPAVADPVSPDAQLVDGNAFLSNGYVEFGAKPNGSFGSTVDAPSGYHPRSPGARLGFRADRDKDGWGVGRDDGDFFTPGNPYEAWALQIGSGPARWNSNGSDDIAGSWTATESTGGTPTATWQSDGAIDGVAVEQKVSVPGGGRLLDVQVTLTNTTSSAIDDVYYGRSVDPDNCATVSEPVCDSNGDGVGDSASSFSTLNTIRGQMSTGDPVSIVSAQQTDGSYLDLRSSASSTAVSQGGPCYLADLGSYFDPTCLGANTKGTATFADSWINLSTRTATLAPGASRTFSVQYVLSSAEAAATNPPPAPPAPAPAAPAAPTQLSVPQATGSKVYSRTGAGTTRLAGRGAPGAVVTVLDGQSKVTSTTVGPDGTWRVQLRGLTPGTHRLSATQTLAGRTSAPSATTVVTVERLAVSIIKATTRTKADRPLIRGRGNAGARIVVRTASGRVLGRTTVADNGRWRLRTKAVAPRTYRVRAYQHLAGQTVRSSKAVFRAFPHRS